MPSPCENEASCIEDTVNESPVCLCKDGFGDINCRTGKCNLRGIKTSHLWGLGPVNSF